MTLRKIIAINLLPWREMKRKRVRRNMGFSIFSGLIFAGILIVIVYGHMTTPKQQAFPRIHKPSIDLNLSHKQRKKLKNRLQKNKIKVEQQSLDSLHYMGLLKDGFRVWGLIGQPDGTVSIVTPDDCLGKEHARVLAIREDVIEIEKTVRGRNGLEKKWILLKLR
jgi:Tfp pilus assembly protein PilP